MEKPVSERAHTEWMVTPVGAGPVARRVVLGIVAVVTLLFLVAPLALIVSSALSQGVGVFVRSLSDPGTQHAIWLTVITALITVPLNILFGLAAAWTVTKFVFPGRTLLIALIELPYSISPIVAGVAYLFVYGSQGLFGPLLDYFGLKVMFALPAIVLASMFVTAPFVARELIPLMQAQGRDLEEAATSLGASGWRTFWRVTLPNIRWPMLYGIVLCNARVMGEFGAVSVVSGNVRGQTNTVPLHVELLYHDYDTAGAFAAAAVLTVLALITLVLKVWLEGRGAGRRKPAAPSGAVSPIIPAGGLAR